MPLKILKVIESRKDPSDKSGRKDAPGTSGRTAGPKADDGGLENFSKRFVIFCFGVLMFLDNEKHDVEIS